MSFNPGTPVLVQWNDGNKYDAQVVQVQGTHVLVGFPNGQQQWIEQQYLELAGAPPGAGSTGAAAAPAVQAAAGALDVQGGIVSYGSAQEYWNELQQTIAQVEQQQIPLGGVDPSNPVTFYEKMFAVTNAEQQGIPQDQAAQQQGFHDAKHMFLIQQYVEAKWSYMGQDETGQPAVLTHETYQNAQAQAAMGNMQNMQADAAAADPNLLAPVDGVSIEQWAKASVALGSLGEGSTPEQVAHKLAEIGMDKASYEAASAGWQAKMQGDTTGAIAMKFSEAFASAQNMSLGGAGGDAEPCTFEHYVEIGAAMDAWSEQGLDCNAKMQEVFGIDAMGFSKYSMYWGMKMTTDMAMMNRQQELHEQLKQKYVGAGMDDDLAF